MLNFTEYGADSGQAPLLIAHGLFGSARNWGVIARRLSETRRVVAVDMRNHGNSTWFQSHSYAEMAEDLAKVIDHLAITPDIVGHSMGGKAAMILALKRPDLLRKVVMADIAPVTYGHSQSHLITAMRGIDLATISTRSDADAQLRDHVDDAGVRAFLLQSLDIKSGQWKLNHDVLENDMDKIVGFPSASGQFDGPSLFLSGSNSDYVLPDHRPEILRLFPKARFAKIPGAGHWLHAEKPREFEAAVKAFLDA